MSTIVAGRAIERGPNEVSLRLSPDNKAEQYDSFAEFFQFYYGWMTSTVIVALLAAVFAWRWFARSTKGAAGPQSLLDIVVIAATAALAVVGISAVGSTFGAPPMLASALTGLIGGICAASILRSGS